MCKPFRRASLSLAALLLTIHCNAAAGTVDPPPLQPLLLNASVNGAVGDEAQLFVRDAEGRVYVSESFLREWRIHFPPTQSVIFEEEKFFVLDSSLPIAATLSEAEQSIALTAPATLFEAQSSAFRNDELMGMTRPGKGAFLNYDLILERSYGSIGASGAVEIGIFHPLGVGSSRFIGHATSGNARLVRLETNWVIDRPEKMTSLRIGDGISSGTPSVAPVRFAGVQYGTNFATQPGFVTMPLQIVSGSAALPSVIDIYVNNILQGSRDVRPGPFDITGVPLQSGGGNIQLVIRDLLGRQIVADESYYSSSQLLKKGLRAFSYEAGFLRRSFGTRSNDYGGPMAAFTYRYGLSDHITAEAIAQASRSTQLAGAGLTVIVGKLGLASGSANVSSSPRGIGQKLGFAVERRTDGPSFGMRAEFATKHFTSLGISSAEGSARSNTQLFVDFPFFVGTVGLNYIRRDHYRLPDEEGRRRETLAGVFASVNLGRIGSLQLFARRSNLGPGKTTLGGHFAIPLGGRRSGAASLEYRRGYRQATLAMQQDLPAGEGFGYRSSITAGKVRSAVGALLINTGTTSWSIEGARTDGGSGVRLSAAGALGLIGQNLFASRRLGESFAAVRLEGLSGVRVYADNQLVGTTDASGKVIIPSMRAYERNSIRIDEADFPLDVQVEETELTVRPFARAGLSLKFAVRRERGVLMRVVLEDGSNLPAGAMVFANGGTSGYVTASGGEVYFPDIVDRARMEARWYGGACVFDLVVPNNDDPQPRVEGLVCKSKVSYAVR